MRERNLSRVGYGWAHSLLSLAFAARWNPKHPSYCKYSVVFMIPFRSSAAESRLYEMFNATDKGMPTISTLNAMYKTLHS